MKRFWKYVTGVVPAYGLFPLVFSFVFNCLVYSGSRAIAGGWYHHNIESSLDLRLPFVPQFLIVYFGCYIFWAVNYILAARQEKEQVYRFFTADLISRCVCLIIFLAYPTTNTRPVIEGSGFSVSWESKTRKEFRHGIKEYLLCWQFWFFCPPFLPSSMFWWMWPVA